MSNEFEPDPILESYKLMKSSGYTGTIENYRTLIKEDQKAVDFSYDLSIKDGYEGSADDYANLLGLGKESSLVVADQATGPGITGSKQKNGSSDLPTEGIDFPEVLDEVVITAKGTDRKLADFLGSEAYQVNTGNQDEGDNYAYLSKKKSEAAASVGGVMYDANAEYVEDENGEVVSGEQKLSLKEFADLHKEEKVIVYGKLSNKEYKDSIKNLKSLKRKQEAAEGVHGQHLTTEKAFNKAYEVHEEKFKTFQDNVHFVDDRQLSNDRFNAKGSDIVATVGYDVNVKNAENFGDDILGIKEKNYIKLTKELKILEEDPDSNKYAIKTMKDRLKDFDYGDKLLDKEGNTIFHKPKSPPKTEEEKLLDDAIIKKSNQLVIDNDEDILLDKRAVAYSNLVGGVLDMESIYQDLLVAEKEGDIATNNIVANKAAQFLAIFSPSFAKTNKNPGLSDAKYVYDKFKPTIDYVKKHNRLPNDIEGLKQLFDYNSSITSRLARLSDSPGIKSEGESAPSMFGGFGDLNKSLSTTWNEQLDDFIILNKALETNTNITTSTEKNVVQEFLDGLGDVVGVKTTTKLEEQGILSNVLSDGQFDQEKVDAQAGLNESSMKQRIAKSFPGFVKFIGALTIAKKFTPIKMTGIKKDVAVALTRAFPGNKVASTIGVGVVSSVVEAFQFGAMADAGNRLSSEKEDVTGAMKSGFFLGFAGHFGKVGISSISKAFTKSRASDIAYNSKIFTGLVKSKAVNKTVQDAFSASLGAFTFVAADTMMNPWDFDIAHAGETMVEEAWKLFFYQKLSGAMSMKGGNTVRRYGELVKADVRTFRKYNESSLKGSKLLGIPLESVKNPTENSEQEIRDAVESRASEVNDKLSRREITEEQATQANEQIEIAVASVRAQQNVNKYNKVMHETEKSGGSLTIGQQIAVAERMKKGVEIGDKDSEIISKMTPESLLLNMGVDITPASRARAQELINNEAHIQAQLNGEGFFIIPGSFAKTNGKIGEFKAVTQELKTKTYKFLRDRYEANRNLLEAQLKLGKVDPIQQKEQARLIEEAQVEFDKYYEGGSKYDALQSRLSGAAALEIIKSKNKPNYLKDDKGERVVEYIKTKEEFQAKVNEIEGTDNKDAKDNTGAFDPNTGKEYINTERALEVKSVSDEVHEDLHFVLKDSLKDDKGNVTEEGIKVIDKILESLNEQERKLLDANIKSRYDTSAPKSEWYEENLTALSELIKEKKITKRKSTKEALIGLIPALRKNYFKNLEINADTGEGMFKMIEGLALGDKYAAIRANEFAKEATDSKKAAKVAKAKERLAKVKLKRKTIQNVEKPLKGQDVENKIETAKLKFSMNTKQNLTFTTEEGATEAEFKIKDKDFKIHMEPSGFVEFPDKVVKNIDAVLEKNNLSEDNFLYNYETSLHVEFADVKEGTGLTNKGDAFEVMSVTANGIIDYVKNAKIELEDGGFGKVDNIMFTAKEASRVKLYNAMSIVMAKKLGWNVDFKDGSYVLWQPKKMSFSKTQELQDKLDNLEIYDFENEIEFEQAQDNLRRKITQESKRESKKPSTSEAKQEVKESVKKLGNSINELIPKGTTKAEYDKDIIKKVSKDLIVGEKLHPLIRKIATGYGITTDNIYQKSWDEFFVAVKNPQFVRNLKKFNPKENNDFGGYVIGSQFGVRNRVKEALAEFKKLAEGGFKENLSKANNIAIDNESSPSKSKITETELTDVTRNPVVKAKLPAIEKAIDITNLGSKDLTYAKATDMFIDKVSEALIGVSGAKASGQVTVSSKSKEKVDQGAVTKMQGLFRGAANIEGFIRVMPEYNVATNETTINKQKEIVDVSKDVKGISIGTNPKTLKVFYEKYVDPKGEMTSPSGRSKGKTTQPGVWRLKPQFRSKVISPKAIKEFAGTIGLTPAGEARIPVKGKARTEFGTVLQGVTKMYMSNVINTVVRKKFLENKPDSEKRSIDTNQELADMGAGKSKLMFNKAGKKKVSKTPKALSGQEVLNEIMGEVVDISKLTKQELTEVRRKVMTGSFPKHLPVSLALRATGWTGGMLVTTANKRGFNLISDVNAIADVKLRQEAINLIENGTLSDLNTIKQNAKKVEADFTEKEMKAFKAAFKGKKGRDWKANIDANDLHNEGVRLSILAELAIAESSPEAFAIIREYLYHPSLNSSANRNQANAIGIERNAKGEIVTFGKNKVTDEHVFQAIEHAKAKLTLYKNVVQDKPGARNSLDNYIKWVNKNYIQFALNNTTDIVKGDLVDAEGNVWKKSGGTSHPLLIKKLYKAIESGKQEDWDKVPSSIIRYFNEFVKLNPNNLYIGEKSVAEAYKVEVPKKFQKYKDVQDLQGELIYKVELTKAGELTGEDAVTKERAAKDIKAFIKLSYSKSVSSESNNDALPSSLKSSKPVSTKESIERLSKVDKALDHARKIDAPIKKIRVFDLDDTLLHTKSKIMYTMPDGVKGKIDAATFAKEAGKLESEGAEWDFSEFSKIMEGRKGPLFDVAKTIADKRGTEDLFVLTARPADAAGPIREFLKSLGLDIPLKNITGLGNGAPEAKADWMVSKAAEGYNDFYFTDDHTGNVKSVKDALSVLDVKSKVQLAKVRFNKTMDKEFNEIIENKTGIAAEKNYAAVKAALVGKTKGKLDFFIPPGAEDFVGLLYKTLGKGAVGDAQMAWYKKSLLNPYARAMENITRDRTSLGRNFKALKKELKIVPRNLKKRIKGEVFTKEQAVRVYIWEQTGEKVPGLSKADQIELVDMVKASPELQLFATEIMKLGKGRGYIKPSEHWTAGTITTDLIESLNTTGRKQYLEQWKQNVDVIFSEKNLNKLEAAFGTSFRVALSGEKGVPGILKRMETGRNRTFGGDTLTGRFVDWINASVGNIMFFNGRSAVLQTISAVNFIDFKDNNIFAAGKAFANLPQYKKDFTKLFTSDYLVERRDGLKMNVNETDIADIAKENGARGLIAKALKLGFAPTQIADSFAIASGGATYYRTRINALVKGGMHPEAAEMQAMRDFREKAEESQQSSRPDKISAQQAGPLGRIVLAFANTPAQYARLTKKAALDLKNGRGDKRENISRILYYSVASNLLFNAMQQALFAVSFGDDEEELGMYDKRKNAKEKEKKAYAIINGMVDSVARGTGVAGAVFSVIKNVGIKLYKETDKDNPKYEDVAMELLKISPPISSKITKVRSAGRSASWDMYDMKNKGWSLDNPAYLAAGNTISAFTNIPLDRIVKKMNNVVAASDEELEAYKRIFLLLGWSEWELGLKDTGPGKSTTVKGGFNTGKGFGTSKGFGAGKGF